MKAGSYFGQSKRHTFNELADQYHPYAKDPVRLDHWRSVFGPETLDAMTASRISKECERLRTEDTQNWATPATGDPDADAKRGKSKRTGPTVNRYLAALSACRTA